MDGKSPILFPATNGADFAFQVVRNFAPRVEPIVLPVHGLTSQPNLTLRNITGFGRFCLQLSVAVYRNG